MDNKQIEITQKSAIGSNTTQIANQTNIYGMSAEKAAEVAMNLFLNNFPKLVEKAQETAKQRAEELCNEIIAKLNVQGKSEYSEFEDPDTQYIINKSQQEYARLGTVELRQLLSDIVVNRINYDSDQYIKIILDEAVEVARFLAPVHLDYLSLILWGKHIINRDVKSMEDLKKLCDYICSTFVVPSKIEKTVPYLNMKGLLVISLGSVEEFFSRNYKFDKNEVRDILPEQFKWVHSDYKLSPVGIALAIINLNSKTSYNLELENFLKLL